MKARSSALAVKSTVKGEVVVSRDLVQAARGFAAAAKSERTRVEYRRDWRTFTDWCEAHRLQSLPATGEAVALFLTARAESGRKVATITRALAAISEAHRAAGLPSPRGNAAVQEVLKGIRRTLGVAQTQKAPLLPGQLRTILQQLGDGPLGLRDRALLLVGFSGAFRRSELVGLDVEDLTFNEEGLEILLRKSKTDQEGAGRKVGIPLGRRTETCPISAVKTWMEVAKIESGPIFREVNRHGRISAQRLSGRSVARIVKRNVEAAGFDPAQFSGHSLRAGLVTAAAKARKSIASIQKQTGHRSVAMVQRYIRDADLFDDNAADDLL